MTLNTHSRDVAEVLAMDAHYGRLDALADAVDRLARDPHEVARALLDGRCAFTVLDAALTHLGLDESADEGALAQAIAAHGLPDFGAIGNRLWEGLLADRVVEHGEGA